MTNPLNNPLFAPYLPSIVASKQPSVCITLHASEQLTAWQSKVGGIPYLPKDTTYPWNQAGQPLALLAQINFAEIPPLPNFPTQGIVQFYINLGGAWGWDCDNPISNKDFRVLYFADVVHDVNQLQQDLIAYSLIDFPNDAFEFDAFDALPFSGQYAMEFTATEQYVSFGDYHFSLTNQITGEIINMSNAHEILYDDDLEEDFLQEYDDCFDSSGHRLGGYPYFVQSDPRVYHPHLADYILLLQLDGDSTANMMWGDAGTCNFFIHPQDLANRDFSKVLYHWECC